MIILSHIAPHPTVSARIKNSRLLSAVTIQMDHIYVGNPMTLYWWHWPHTLYLADLKLQKNSTLHRIWAPAAFVACVQFAMWMFSLRNISVQIFYLPVSWLWMCLLPSDLYLFRIHVYEVHPSCDDSSEKETRWPVLAWRGDFVSLSKQHTCLWILKIITEGRTAKKNPSVARQHLCQLQQWLGHSLDVVQGFLSEKNFSLSSLLGFS